MAMIIVSKSHFSFVFRQKDLGLTAFSDLRTVKVPFLVPLGECVFVYHEKSLGGRESDKFDIICKCDLTPRLRYWLVRNWHRIYC